MKEYRLGDIIEIKHGYAFDGEHIVQEDNGIVLVTPGNFRIGGGFQEEKCKFFTGEIPDEYVLSAGDFIVTMTDLSKEIDTLGYSAIVPESNRTYLHNQRIGLISFKNDECYPGYVYFLMRTHLYQRSIANTSTGATVHHTSPAKICDYRFSAPDYETQRKIADYLFVYEKLIGNNQKQIKLLEEAAQRLYKEWFVDLRFPGHETTPITDGIPEGWVEGKISDFVSTFSGGTPSRTHPEYYSDGTNLWVKTQELNDGFIFDTEEKITNDAISNSSAKRIPQGSVLMAMYGATIGKLGIAAKELTCNQACCVFDLTKRRFATLYLFLWLKENRGFFISQGKGAAQPNLSQAMIKNFHIIIPSDDILMAFAKVTDIMMQKISKLQLQNIGLIEARDRLLPKLMNGEIEV